MKDKIWLGGIFLKDEGGYEIIFRSLLHYKKRLMVIDQSPEIKDSAAMFGGILKQAAIKIIPQIDEMIKKIKTDLPENQQIDSLKENIPFLEKALISYETDIQKAQDTGHQYYLNLLGNIELKKDDLKLIQIAKSKLREFE